VTVEEVAQGGLQSPPIGAILPLLKRTTPMSTATYNGWTNYETWNVALWIQNDESLYKIARRYDDYLKFVKHVWFDAKTPDGVSYTDPKLDWDELNEMMADL
jgi:hypothetical protein